MVRVGLIGFGLSGRVFHAPYIARTPGMQLTAIATTAVADAHTAWPSARICRPGELIDSDVDVVVVATPSASHAELGLMALQADKAVVIDKPMALSRAATSSLMEVAAERGLVLSPFHNRRWDDDFLTLQAVLAEGAIGRLHTFHSRFDRFRPAVADRWREKPGPGGGLWSDLGPHLVDQAIHLLGRPDAVTADFAQQRQGAQVDDYVHVILHFGSSRAVLGAGSLVTSRSPRLVAEADLGSFVTHGFDLQEQRLREPAEAQPRDRAATVVTIAGGGRVHHRRPLIDGDYGRFYQGMVAALRAGGPPPVSAEDALLVAEILDAARLSVGRRQTIDLPARDGG